MIEKLQNLLFEHGPRYVGRHRATGTAPALQLAVRRGRGGTVA